MAICADAISFLTWHEATSLYMQEEDTCLDEVVGYSAAAFGLYCQVLLLDTIVYQVRHYIVRQLRIADAHIFAARMGIRASLSAQCFPLSFLLGGVVHSIFNHRTPGLSGPLVALVPMDTAPPDYAGFGSSHFKSGHQCRTKLTND